MPNRLADATSPYLLQHKENPVDWWEWGEDAFAEARRRDVPILLSVGYAACHWCHVMAHESFEDADTARVMNERFVNIKVDREERPDVDSVYMEAVQAMTGQGGWPMTVWMDHEKRPFFAGTYFPGEPRHGMASFSQVMDAVSTAWQERRDDVSEQAERLVAAISRVLPVGDTPDAEVLARAYDQIESSFDAVHGGFGRAPKFPQQPVLEFMLRVKDEPWAAGAAEMLGKTLEEMAAGGIHDQIGGGFARYSVDHRWLVPHFEKMLYDNAQLARLYLWAGLELERPDFVEVARSTLDYLDRDLRDPAGGFYSSEDADSEGVEGKFYVWSEDELRRVLGADAEDAIAYYGVTEGGNFEGDNILSVVGTDPPHRLDEIKAQLLDTRSSRIRPGLDDKVIASWNGLAIRALAEAGAALGEPRYLQLATEAATFVTEQLVDGETLMRSWRAGRTSVPAFLDDHAALAVGLFTLYSATGELRWYEEAIALVGMLDMFTKEDGGFYSTREQTEASLVKRPSDVTDNPLPSGNGLAAEALLISSLFTGKESTRAQAESALASVGALAERYPSMVGHHLAVAHSIGDTREVAIVGEGWRDLATVFWSGYRPNVVLAPSPTGSDPVPLLAGRDRPSSGSLAYVCRGFSCELPTSDP
ncbi:MAG TPA: thioredoxin domain-containing protein, partial [Acidimicrobiia bacterium]|nr:thioredoxin domain-containing protein [Acidimicrobiia bacterium]